MLVLSQAQSLEAGNGVGAVWRLKGTESIQELILRSYSRFIHTQSITLHISFVHKYSGILGIYGLKMLNTYQGPTTESWPFPPLVILKDSQSSLTRHKRVLKDKSHSIYLNKRRFVQQLELRSLSRKIQTRICTYSKTKS